MKEKRVNTECDIALSYGHKDIFLKREVAARTGKYIKHLTWWVGKEEKKYIDVMTVIEWYFGTIEL